MNLSQIILLLAAFVILSVSILMINKTSLETNDSRLKAKNQIIALTEAQNLFEEIKTKNFDEKIFSIGTLNRDSLTPAENFGPENEIYPAFDDIDDFNNFNQNVFVENKLAYNLIVSVFYANENNPNQISVSRTFYKLVTISCFDQSQSKVFELKQIFSAW